MTLEQALEFIDDDELVARPLSVFIGIVTRLNVAAACRALKDD